MQQIRGGPWLFGDSGSAETSGAGRYEFSGLRKGEYTLVASTAEASSERKRVSVGQGEDVEMDLVVEPHRVVTGRVVAADDGAAIEGARVAWEEITESPRLRGLAAMMRVLREPLGMGRGPNETSSTDGGWFELQVPSYPVSLRVEADGFAREIVPIGVGVESAGAIALDPLGAIRGRILNVEALPSAATAVAVKADDETMRPVAERTVGRGGEFVLDGLTDGAYCLGVRWGNVTVLFKEEYSLDRHAAPKGVNLEVPELGTVRFRGPALEEPDLAVFARLEDERRRVAWRVADAKSLLEDALHLPVGVYDVAVKSGGVELRKRVAVQRDREAVVVLEFGGSSISVALRCADNPASVRRRLVRLERLGARDIVGSARTNDEGVVTFEGLPSGRYHVEVLERVPLSQVFSVVERMLSAPDGVEVGRNGEGAASVDAEAVVSVQEGEREALELDVGRGHGARGAARRER